MYVKIDITSMELIPAPNVHMIVSTVISMDCAPNVMLLKIIGQWTYQPIDVFLCQVTMTTTIEYVLHVQLDALPVFLPPSAQLAIEAISSSTMFAVSSVLTDFSLRMEQIPVKDVLMTV